MSDVAATEQLRARIDWRPDARPLGWWGMVLFIATEAMFFGLLLFVYLFLRAQATEWPPVGVAEPELAVSGVRSVVLLSSSLPMLLAERGARRGDRRRLVWGLGATFLLAALFFVGHVEEARTLWAEGERPGLNSYTSAFWTVTNAHALHLLVGMAMVAFTWTRAVLGRYRAGEHLGVQLTAMYWHFVDIVWVAVYATLYLSVSVG